MQWRLAYINACVGAEDWFELTPRRSVALTHAPEYMVHGAKSRLAAGGAVVIRIELYYCCMLEPTWHTVGRLIRQQ